MDEGFSSRRREAVSDFGNAAEETWGSKERVGSRTTPRLRARGEGEMIELSRER